jgi:hypothetical protein
MKILLLDRRGEVDAPPGYTIIESEAAWLHAICALTDGENLNNKDEPALLVRGAALCEWAAAWWRGRGWPCEERRSPLLALLALCPTWSEDEARTTLDELRPVWDELEGSRLRMASVLSHLYPQQEMMFTWDATPSLTHAAAYLLWLESANIAPHHMALIAAQAQGWDAGAGPAQGLYAATRQEAEARLRAWLEAWPINSEEAQHLVRRFSNRERWGIFPLPLPPRWERTIRQSAGAQLAREGIPAWHKARRAALHGAARSQWAAATLDWLRAHPDGAIPAVAQTLAPHLSPLDATQLRRLVPPPDPGNLFEGTRPRPTDVLEWVSARYTPWRLWQVEHGGEAEHVRALQLAEAFGLWFLRFYSDALLGAHAGALSMRRAQELRTEGSSQVTLWIIADGLGLSDAQALWSHIERRTQLLTFQANEPVFAAIPTITHFAKPALRYGVSPAQALDPSDVVWDNATRREVEVQGHRDVTRALAQAQPGDLVVWTPLEPDKTYHETADISLTRAAVDGALSALAETIAEAARATPTELQLQVLICTDHGRLLGHSRRVHVVPNNFASHGRAAYQGTDAGESPRYDSEGIFRLEASHSTVALLDPDRFGLRERVAIALDDGSFQDNAGRSGGENFPHGGIFPEEVTVPWVVLTRGADEVRVEARGSGRARPGTAGTLHLEIVNPGATRLFLVGIELRFGARDERLLPVEELIPSFDALHLERELTSWPMGAQAGAATCRLLLRHSDGREFSAPVTLQLESDELQTRENILDELL